MIPLPRRERPFGRPRLRTWPCSMHSIHWGHAAPHDAIPHVGTCQGGCTTPPPLPQQGSRLPHPFGHRHQQHTMHQRAPPREAPAASATERLRAELARIRPVDSPRLLPSLRSGSSDSMGDQMPVRTSRARHGDSTMPWSGEPRRAGVAPAKSSQYELSQTRAGHSERARSCRVPYMCLDGRRRIVFLVIPRLSPLQPTASVSPVRW